MWNIPTDPLSINLSLAEFCDTLEFQALQQGCDPDIVFKTDYSTLYIIIIIII